MSWVKDNVIDPLTGKSGADAAEESARQQAQAGRESIAFLEESRDLAREDLEPFRRFGEMGTVRASNFLSTANEPLEAAERLITPEGQQEFLSGNPILDAAMDRITRETKTFNAASGRSGGGVVNQLFENYLSQGDRFLNSQLNRIGAVDTLRGNEFQRRMAPVRVGLGAATGQSQAAIGTGENVANTIADIGAARAGGTVGAANARSAGINNLLGMGGGALLGSGVLGGAGLAGGGAAGGLLGALAFSDERMKDVSEFVGYDENGLKVYKWQYKGDDVTHYGPMAQDVADVMPEAVYMHKPSGNLLLDMRQL